MTRVPPPAAGNSGFTITELLIAMAVTLAVTGAAFTALRDANRAAEAVGVMSDVNQTLRIAMNTVMRDLSQAGEGDYGLRTGVSIPNGAGTDLIVRPGPADAEWYFPDTYTVLPAVSPASGIGPVINGIATDVVTLLVEDRSLLMFGANANIPASGASMNFPVAFDMGSGANALKEGDLIRFGSGAIQEVTRVAGRTLHFRDDALSNLNQRDAPQGSVMEMKYGNSNFSNELEVSRVQMITYYIRLSDAGVPQLVRRVNYFEERVIAVGVENLQFSWDLVDGITNPTNVETFADDGAEGQIRKAHVYMAARSIDTYSGTDQPMRMSLSTQVSLRSLAFVSRYDLQ